MDSKSIMIKANFTFLLILIGQLVPSLLSGAEKFSDGLIFIVGLEGEVKFFDNQGNEVGENKFVVGSPFPKNHTAETGKGGKAVFLLSNGTLMTVDQNAKMKVSFYDQIPFEAKGRALKDLTEEPSQSNVNIDLDFGALIVKTKKLNKKSSFSILSPVGTAGIRGTEFQMEINPGAGVQLDVTESVVEFTPSGGGQPVSVRQGNGLSISSTGVPSVRPVNPVVAQKISNINGSAIKLSADIPMDSISGSVGQEKAKPGKRRGDRQEVVPQEEEELFKDPRTRDDERRQKGKNRDARNNEVQPVGASVGNGNRADRINREEYFPERGVTMTVLENNPEIKQVRKTAKVNSMTSKIARIGLSDEENLRFIGFSIEVQGRLLEENKKVMRRLLTMEGFYIEQANAFFMYSPDTRSIILELNDAAIISGLNQEIDEALLRETISPEDIGRSSPDNLPEVTNLLANDSEILELSNLFKESGHVGLMEELYLLSNGKITTEWVEIGKQANQFLKDYDWSTNSLPGILSGGDASANPFFSPVLTLFQEVENDSLIYGVPDFIPGNNQIVSGNADSLSPYFGNGRKNVAIASLEKLSVKGDIEWDANQGEQTQLSLMSDGDIEIEKGGTLKSSSSDLLIATRQDLNMEDVTIDVSQRASLRSLRNVDLKNVTVSASSEAIVKARKNLNINGLTFRRDVPKILMEATTIRLQNINFPAQSAVRLNSLHGPIGGKYPNFGTAISAAQQVGRVNFIKNVSSGGNVMNNRQSFDQFGTNIKIGKINRP